MRAAIVVLSLALAGCFPGGEGWDCEIKATAPVFGPTSYDKDPTPARSDDCNDKLYCTAVGGHNGVTKSACMAHGAERVSSTYGWFHVVLFWGTSAIVVLAALVFVAGKLRARQE